MRSQVTAYLPAELSLEEPWSAHRVDGLDQAALGAARKSGGTPDEGNASSDHTHMQVVWQQVHGMCQQQEHHLPLKPLKHHLQREAALHWLYGGRSHPIAPESNPFLPDRPSGSTQHHVGNQQHIQGSSHQALKAEMEVLQHQNQSLLQQLCTVLADSRAAQQENLKRRRIMTAAAASTLAATATEPSKPYCTDFLQTPAARRAAASGAPLLEVPAGAFIADHNTQQPQGHHHQQNKQEVEKPAAVNNKSSSDYGSCGAPAVAERHAVGGQPPADAPPIRASAVRLADDCSVHSQHRQVLQLQAQPQQQVKHPYLLGQQQAIGLPTRARTPRICLNLEDEQVVQLHQQKAVSDSKHVCNTSTAFKGTPGPHVAEDDSEQPDAPRNQRMSGLRLDLTDQCR